MARYKVTFGYLKHTFGASESYISPDMSPSIATGRIQALLDARNACLHFEVEWAGVRISQADKKRRSVFYPPGTYQPFIATADLVIPATGAMIETGAVNDQARSSMLVRYTYDTDRRVNRYFAFPPDSILRSEPASLAFHVQPGYSIRFGSFVNEMIQRSWAIRALSRDGAFVERPIRDWVQAAAAPVNLGVVLDSLPAPGIQEGDFVAIKNVRRRGLDRSSYNGRYFVHSVNTTLQANRIIYYLRGTEAGDSTTVRLPGTIQKVGYEYFGIQGGEGVKAVVHKRGKPLGSPRGSSRRRVGLAL